jgi:hypothetical protein
LLAFIKINSFTFKCILVLIFGLNICHRISRAQESGIYDEWISQGKKFKAAFFGPYKEGYQERLASQILTLNSLQGVFILWFCGISISVCVLILEIASNKFKNRLNQLN